MLMTYGNATCKRLARSRGAAACLAWLTLTACSTPGPAIASGVADATGAGPAAVKPSAAVKPVRTPHAGPDEAARARTAVRDLLVLRCEKANDCATVGIGERSCGGPEQFVAYAPALTPQAELQRAVQAHAKLRRQQQEARGEMSTCEMLPDPGAFCSAAGQCTVHPTRRGVPGSAAR